MVKKLFVFTVTAETTMVVVADDLDEAHAVAREYADDALSDAAALHSAEASLDYEITSKDGLRHSGCSEGHLPYGDNPGELTCHEILDAASQALALEKAEAAMAARQLTLKLTPAVRVRDQVSDTNHTEG